MTDQAVKFMREELDRVDKRVADIHDKHSDVLAKMSEFIRYAEKDRQEYIAKIETIAIEVNNRDAMCIEHDSKIKGLSDKFNWVLGLMTAVFLAVLTQLIKR